MATRLHTVDTREMIPKVETAVRSAALSEATGSESGVRGGGSIIVELDSVTGRETSTMAMLSSSLSCLAESRVAPK